MKFIRLTGWMILSGILPLFAEHIEVTANEMKAFDISKEIHFIGDANASQGKNWIHGDRIVIYLSKNNKAKRYMAKGKVTFRIEHDNAFYVGKADVVTYNPEKSLYVLAGNAVVDDIRNKRHLKGARIVLNTATGYANVTSAKGKTKKDAKKPVKFIFETEN